MAFDDKLDNDNKYSKEPSFGLPPGSCGCGKPAQVSMLTAVNQNTGDAVTGAASEMCYYGKGGVMEMKSQYSFQHWESYCRNCWVGTKASGNRTYTDLEVRTAWLWFMGRICAGSKNFEGIFQEKGPIPIENQEGYIVIVNNEAKRCNEPDSIPNEYKLSQVWG